MILAEWAEEDGLAHALQRFREARIGPLETYTPAPLQDEPVTSPIPLIILLAGLLGAAASFGLQSYSFLVAYPFDIGGRPQFAWASFIPTAFENAVLVAIAAGFVAYMVINRLPRLYDPVDESDAMRRATRDRWFLQVATEDPAVLASARALLGGLHPVSVEELPG
jgi:hypothetical protein